MKKIVIAIDGHSGTGKSSTAKLVARQLGYIYIDSGAMYRAVTYHFLKNNVELNDLPHIRESLQSCEIVFKKGILFLNNEGIEKHIRSMGVNEKVSKVSAISMVRSRLVEQQRKIGAGKGIVMDGRDIGTVVFPDAELKIFMTANIRIRAERRQKELKEKGIFENLEDIEANLIERDRIDSTREDSPLRITNDAIEIDTSQLTLNQQVDKIVLLAQSIIYES